MTSTEGRKLHGLAEQARENGDFLKALELTDQAMIAYQKDGDQLGFAEIQASRFLTLRHLFEQTEDQNYLILAKYSAEASVELAKKSNDPKAVAIPAFNLAKAEETLGQLTEAVANYQKALDNMAKNPPSEHSGARLAILADMKIHLLVCQYKTGNKEVINELDQTISQLFTTEEEKYNQDVWLSGAHLKMAEILKNDNLEKAKAHLQKAKEIIDSNPDLKLRKAQWEKLAASFN